MYHTWRELLFLHWRFDPAEVQATLPAGLTEITLTPNGKILEHKTK